MISLITTSARTGGAIARASASAAERTDLMATPEKRRDATFGTGFHFPGANVAVKRL
jgi:hypothetical protein